MTTARQANHDLDDLIWEITADAHDEDEQLMGFEAAFDEANLHAPAPSSVRKYKSCPSARRTTVTNSSPPAGAAAAPTTSRYWTSNSTPTPTPHA